MAANDSYRFRIPLKIGGEDIDLSYTGPALKDGMDVADFLSAIEGMDGVVQGANRVLNGPDAPRVPVRIGEPKKERYKT